MKKLLGVLIILALIYACSNTKETVKAPTLTQKWQTDTLLTTCESVLYDKEKDVLYVANIAGNPSAKDSVGSIGKVGLDGAIIDAQWVKGLNAPKGMGLFNGKLYVADIDKVVEIDVNTGAITNSYVVEGAQFLNDVTVDATGKVYVSDSNTGNVSLIENGTVSTFLTGQDGPNGLLSDGDKFLIALWNKKTLNTVDGAKAVTMLADSIDNPDGIEALGNGAYLVSSWNGMVTFVAPDGTTTPVVDTRADSVSAADIEYIAEKKLLLIPTFFKNRVVAYELSDNK